MSPRSISVEENWKPRIIPGWLSIVPPLLAIALAILTRQVLIALVAGIWIGLCILLANPLTALLRTFDTNILNSIKDSDNASIILFTLALGGMIGIISRSGGMKALVDAISERARTRRSGMVITWLMGLVVFFDDYANCLLVGNTVRPFTDAKKISREKLSFLVDATAAPVAGIAIISTWIGFELLQLVNTGIVTGAQSYLVFIDTIPYRFYNILMLFFVLIIALSQRDFGPMLRAERRALSTGQVLREGAQPLTDRELTEMEVPKGKRLYWQNAVIPIVAVVGFVVLGLYLNGAASLGEKQTALDEAIQVGGPGQEELRAEIEGGVFANADAFTVLIWAAFGGSLVALLMALLTRATRLSAAMEGWVKGCKAMMPAVLILVLAWSLGGICRSELLTGQWLASLIQPSAKWMPLIIFVLSCLIAFSTGTSFGTMAIVFPIAGPMLQQVTGGDLTDPITLATLSSVMSGAVFGDHCSPISDTTIMSSMASGADHVDHVRTQAPYALVCAGVAALVGYVPVGFGMSPWISLILGAGILVGLIFFIGKRAEDAS